MNLMSRLLALLMALALLLSASGLAEAELFAEAPLEAVEFAAADAGVPEVEEFSLTDAPSILAAEPQWQELPSADDAGNAMEGPAEVAAPAEVYDAPMPILLPPTLAQAELTLGVKEKFTLTLANGALPAEAGAAFTSSKTKVATVDKATGAITAKATGKATITADVGGVTSSCVVTVKKAPSKIKLSKTSLTLGVGEGFGLGYTLSSNSASAVTYSSNKPAVAVVDAFGFISAVGTGSATITAKTFNGKKATCKVTVKPAPQSIAISPNMLTLWVGRTAKLTPTLSAGSAGAVGYLTSNPAVATVSGNTLSAVGIGSAVVTVFTYNGLTADVYVEVTKVPVYRALLVGESNFPNSGSPSLPGKQDANLMAKMLNSVKGPAGGKWEVTTRYDRTSSQIYSDIQTAFAGAQDGDVSLFFISSHGDEDRTLDGAYASYAGCLQTYPDYRYYNWYDRNTLKLPTLAAWLAAVPGQVIVLIDSCGSGAAIYTGKGAFPAFTPDGFDEAVVEAFRAKDVGVLAPGEQGAFVVQNKFFVMTSADYLETGWSANGKYSYFTKWLTDAIKTSGKMPADSNKNKTTTLNELYAYVKKTSDKKVFKYQGVNYRQHVQVYPANSSFELFYRK